MGRACGKPSQMKSLESQRIVGMMNKHGGFPYIEGELGEISGSTCIWFSSRYKNLCNQIILSL
jgi:hypothetical protein